MSKVSSIARRRNLPVSDEQKSRERFEALVTYTHLFLGALTRWSCDSSLHIIDSHPEKDTWQENSGGPFSQAWQKGAGIRGVHIPIRTPMVADINSIVVRTRTTGGIIRPKKHDTQLELAARIGSKTNGMGKLTDNTINTRGLVRCPWITGSLGLSMPDVADHEYAQRRYYANGYVARIAAGQLLSHIVERAAHVQQVELPEERPMDNHLAAHWARIGGSSRLADDYVQQLREYYESPQPFQQVLPSGSSV